MPYKIPAKLKLSEGQKRVRLIWYRKCSCGGEQRVYVLCYRQHLCKVRCRKCRTTDQMSTPETRSITIEEWRERGGLEIGKEEPQDASNR